MIWLAAIGVLAGLTWMFLQVESDAGKPQIQTTTGANETVVRLQRGRSGHYTAPGTINGRAVNFLLDTGATDVAVSADLARKLGLRFGPQISLQTANGVVRGNLTRLGEVGLGGITLSNIRATIGPDLGSDVLLGMSFLGKLDWQQSGDELLLKHTNTD